MTQPADEPLDTFLSRLPEGEYAALTRLMARDEPAEPERTAYRGGHNR